MSYELSKEEQQRVLEEHATGKDLKQIVKAIFPEEGKDGRSEEGRAVRAFLAKQGKRYATSKFERADFELTPEQKEFLMSDQLERGTRPLEIARLCFQDKDIASLSLQHRAVVEFLRRYRPEILSSEDILAEDGWSPPKAVSRAIKKVNDWAGETIVEDQMTMNEKRCVESLLIFLNSPRFINIINQFATQADRDLFESEYVRAVWDKPDLTVDEQNLYINICSNYVRQKHIQKRLDKLNGLINDAHTQNEMTIRLTELIKTTSEEMDKCEKRIESLIQKLNGDRSKRLADRQSKAANILALVEAFQDKEERDRLVMFAERQREAMSLEADRLESVDELKARILGISKRELL